jgi:hypothetical protein
LGEFEKGGLIYSHGKQLPTNLEGHEHDGEGMGRVGGVERGNGRITHNYDNGGDGHGLFHEIDTN